jgi:hypothetical protein
MTEMTSGDRPTLAEQELAEARRDPRLSHGKGAMVADWWAAMKAAERARKLWVWGLHELTLSLEREEAQLGSRHGDPHMPARHKPELEAAWERRELAKAEQDNDTVELNAMTLVAMVSALDAMVEQLVPGAQEMLIAGLIHRAEEQFSEVQSEAFSKLPEEDREAKKDAAADALKRGLPKVGRPSKVGAVRWERLLKQVGLQAPPNRPVPADLDQALAEIVALRHVLVHKAGRVDKRALEDAPSLGQKDGELVRLKRTEYIRYSAALWTYGEEVIFRLMRDLGTPVDLAGWRQNYTLGS